MLDNAIVDEIVNNPPLQKDTLPGAQSQEGGNVRAFNQGITCNACRNDHQTRSGYDERKQRNGTIRAEAYQRQEREDRSL